MNKKISIGVIFVLATLATISCTQKKQAYIELNKSQKTSLSGETVKASKAPSQMKREGLNYYTIKKGDTILTISKKLRVDIPEIVAINELQAPYRLKPGDVIYLPEESLKKEASAATEEKKSINKPVDIEKPIEKEISDNENDSYNPSFSENFIWPVKGSVISEYGSQAGGINNYGIDIKAPAGTEVKAAAEGKVIFVGKHLKGYGNLVLIKHNEEWVSAYAHQKKMLVKKGDVVNQGQIIGYVGKTGNIDIPKLHFALRKGGKSVNPLSYISS